MVATTEILQDVRDGATPEGRRRILANGYPTILTIGKRPISKGWSQGEVTSEKLAAMEASHSGPANTGILTGTLAAVDIDIHDTDHVRILIDAVTEVLGETLMRRVGSKGVALCYFNPEPIGKISVAGRPRGTTVARPLVEFLGRGQQIVAYGIHTDTHRPYEWIYAWLGYEPLTVQLEELPPVSAKSLQAAADVTVKILSGLGYDGVDNYCRFAGDPQASESLERPPVTVQILVEMLRYISPTCDRATWLRVAIGLKCANVLDSDYDGCGLFVRWSRGDLHDSVAPSNFASEQDCEKTWNSIRRRRGNAL